MNSCSEKWEQRFRLENSAPLIKRPCSRSVFLDNSRRWVWRNFGKQRKNRSRRNRSRCMKTKSVFWQRCFGENITKRQRHSRSKSLSLKTSLSQSMSFNKKADLQRKPRKNYLSAFLALTFIMSSFKMSRKSRRMLKKLPTFRTWNLLLSMFSDHVEFECKGS